MIKSLLLMPFVLEINHGAIQHDSTGKVAQVLHRKYSDVFEKLEELVNYHINSQVKTSLTLSSPHCTHFMLPLFFNLFRDLLTSQLAGNPLLSKLAELVPNIGNFFTPLPLVRSFLEYDQVHHISRRSFIPPSFNDVRHILNRAQIHAISQKLKLITFDADQTIYKDGKDLEQGGEICSYIIRLLRTGLKVAIVTAASYPNNPSKYEGRLAGLLHAFAQEGFPEEVSSRFFVMGGECSFMFKHQGGKLVQIPGDEFQLEDMVSL